MSQTNRKCFIIGIAGSSCSGKTSFTKMLVKELRQLFGEEYVSELDLDGWYKNPPPGTEGKDFNWDDPDNFDKNGIVESITQLKKGEDIWAPVHDYKNYRQIPKSLYVKSAPVLVIENLFTLHWKEILEILDLKIYIDCEQDIALARRLLRDNKERGYSYPTIIERYSKHVKPSFKKYVNPSKFEATIIIPNHCGISDGEIEKEKLEIVINHVIRKHIQ